MDFFKQAQKLAETASQKAWETTCEAQQQVLNAVSQVERQGAEVLQQTSQTVDSMQSAIAGGVASGMMVTNALKDLPGTADALLREMPGIARRLSQAGLRRGDAPRSDADVMALFNKIPGTSKLEANAANIHEFLANKDGSHIISRQQGGSNRADNIVWEVSASNRLRGARNMTGGEQVYIRVHNAVESIVANSTAIAKLGIQATGTAILTQAVVSAISYSLDLYRGELTLEDYRERILQEVAATGISAAAFFLIFIVVLALFPEIAFLLSAPAVVAGFNALFGIGVATPIMQSVIRHIQAGGCGQEAAEGYQNLVTEAQAFVETTTSQVTRVGESITMGLQGFLPLQES